MRKGWLAVGGAAALMAPVLPALAGQGTTSGGGPCSWEMYQHDPLRTGDAGACSAPQVITAANVSQLRPRWFFNTSLAAVTASPVVGGDVVYVGDSAGVFHALQADASSPSGNELWNFNIKSNKCSNDGHSPSYGEITSSAAYWGGTQQPHTATVYFGGGGTVYALDAQTGQSRWCLDTDPAQPGSPAEVESSPLLYWPSDNRGQAPVVIVGNDVNESTGQDATGVMAIDGATGALLWKFDPETEGVTRGTPSLRDAPNTDKHNGCGDVWSSPAYDAADGLVIFTTGNCSRSQPKPNDSPITPKVSTEAVWALHVSDGTYAWDLPQSIAPAGATTCDRPYGGDDDFGASPVVTTLDGETLVLAASKAGCIYKIQASNGALIHQTQAAQPGQSGPEFAGAVGGFIGSTALAGEASGSQTMFASSAIPLPFGGAGPDPTALQGAGSDPQGSLQGAAPLDPSLAGDPRRAASLHAVDVRSGEVLWHQVLATASYAPVTYAAGVVFAPSTTSFAIEAFDAASGLPLWVFPTGASMSSGAAVVGGQIFVGAGTNENQSPPVPPQATGVWSFALPGA